MKEDGLISDYEGYWRLPEPVREAWLLYAGERAASRREERKRQKRHRRR